MGEPQHKKVNDKSSCFAQRWKPMTFLSNTFMVTITQDDSKKQNDSNMHTWLKLGFFLIWKRIWFKMMDH